MKKFIITAILVNLLALPALALPTITLAAVCGNDLCEAGETPDNCPADCAIPPPIGVAEVITIIDRIANWIFAIFLAVAVIFILIAAYQFLTSGGDPTKVGSARNNLLYALIGIAVAFLAKGLVVLVRFMLGI